MKKKSERKEDQTRQRYPPYFVVEWICSEALGGHTWTGNASYPSGDIKVNGLRAASKYAALPEYFLDLESKKERSCENCNKRPQHDQAGTQVGEKARSVPPKPPIGKPNEASFLSGSSSAALPSTSGPALPWPWSSSRP